MSTVTARPTEAPGHRRAWGWVAHLESAGTTPWSVWRRAGWHDDLPAAGPWLPGAQQLELLRRLNLAGRPTPALVRRVLAAAAVGRGRHDLALVGADVDGGFGPDPVDPAALTDDDLLRVAVGLLARDLADSAAPASGETHRRPRRNCRLLRARYRLVGDPELAVPRRAALVADGRPPGGQGAAVLVLGTDLATMLGHAWLAGSFAEGAPPWPGYLEAWRQRAGVPRRIDLPAIADRWRAHPGTGRLTVVLDVDQVPAQLGLPRNGPALTTPPSLSPAAGDLGRRTATALGLLVTPEHRAQLLADRLRPQLARLAHASHGPTEPGPVVPEEHRAWVVERASRLRDRLVRSGLPIVGDPDVLLPRWEQPDATPAAPSPLHLAITLLLDGAR